MEPMMLGSPGSPPTTTTLPCFLFGDYAIPPAPTSPPKKVDSPKKFASPSRYPDASFLYNRSLQTSPGMRDIPQRPNAPPVLELGDTFDPYGGTKRQLNYGRPHVDVDQSLSSVSQYDLRLASYKGREEFDSMSDFANGTGYQNGSDPYGGSPPLRRPSKLQVEQEPDPGVWVTVFGFPPDQAGSILNFFLTLGNVAQHRPLEKGTNWFHLRYPSSSAAEKAIGRNGTIVHGVMVGVKRSDQSEATQRANMNGGSRFNGSGICASQGDMSVVRDAATPVRLMGIGSAPIDNRPMFPPQPQIPVDVTQHPQRDKGLLKWAYDTLFGV